MRAKFKSFQGLVFTPNRDKLLLWALKKKRKIHFNVYMVSEWRINEYRVLKTSSLAKKVFFPKLPRKREDQRALVVFEKVLTSQCTVTDLKQLFGLRKQKW